MDRTFDGNAPPSSGARAAFALLCAAAIWTIVLALHAARPAPAIAIAGAVNLVITSTLAVYLLGVRRGHLPRWTATLTATLGAVVARTVLLRGGGATRAGLAVAGALELAVVVVLAVRFRRARRAWRGARNSGAGFQDALERAFGATGVPPRVADIFASEAAVIASAAAGWRTPAPSADRFTVHRETSWTLIIGVLVALTLVETPLVHLVLVAAGATTAAWIATGLSLYGVLWLVGDLHALRHGGVFVTVDALELRLGVRWRARVPRAAIACVARGTAPEGACDVSVQGANVIVTLASPCTLRGLFGRRRTASVLALSIDDPDGFVARVAAAPPLPE